MDSAPAGKGRPGADAPFIDEGHVAALERMLGRPRTTALLKQLAARIPAHLEAIDRALAMGNADALSREAHGLKGASSMLGLSYLAAAAQRLCLAAKEPGHARTAKDEVRAAAEATLPWMAKRIRTAGPAVFGWCTPCAPRTPAGRRPYASGR